MKIIIKVFLGYFQQNEYCVIFEIKIFVAKTQRKSEFEFRHIYGFPYVTLLDCSL